MVQSHNDVVRATIDTWNDFNEQCLDTWLANGHVVNNQ
jgi:hypothetical protein